MKQVILLCSLLPSVLATAFGSNSAVVTSQDVRDGLDASKLSLTPGGKYRVYAVYASSATSDVYARNVVIKGADNAQFTIATLSTPKLNTGYILDNANELTAPITITDNNPTTSETGFPARVPFTIYLVSTTIPVAPVVSAQFFQEHVDSSLAKLSSPACTILSAEMAFWLSDVVIDTTTMNTIDISTAGYDAVFDGYTVMEVTANSPGSSVAISGPIATLYNTNALPANFSFVVKTEGNWYGSMTAGDSTAFLSNGWLSVSASYRVDYSNEYVLARSYDFGSESYDNARWDPLAQVSFVPTVGNYYPDKGDSVKLSCGKSDGNSTVYDCAALAGTKQKDLCKTISLNVVRGTVDGPRFKVKIETTSGAFSTSMFVLLIGSLLRLLN